MSKKVSLSSPIIILSVLVLVGGAFIGGWFADNYRYTHGLNFATLEPLYQELQSKFDGPLNQANLLDGAKEGLVAGAGDPYTVYLPPNQLKSLNDELSGTLSGIGAEVGIKNNKLVIISPIAGSPADKAGLKAGDIIAAIDGKDSSQYTLDEAVDHIRGQAGTQVKLTIIRGSSEPINVTITRAVINVPPINWSMKGNGIGYIQITQFGNQSNMDDLMAQAAQQLQAQGAKKLVLDLRNDPGGYLDSAVDIASYFLNKQLVVSERHGSTTIDQKYSSSGGAFVGWPVVVLINGGSASASEILAGALHDHHAATLIGEKSFGKGSVQEVENLPGGAGLKITIAHWYTPNGINIGAKGIQPDQTVDLSQADSDAGRDPQLDAAISALSK